MWVCVGEQSIPDILLRHCRAFVIARLITAPLWFLNKAIASHPLRQEAAAAAATAAPHRANRKKTTKKRFIDTWTSKHIINVVVAVVTFSRMSGTLFMTPLPLRSLSTCYANEQHSQAQAPDKLIFLFIICFASDMTFIGQFEWKNAIRVLLLLLLLEHLSWWYAIQSF